VGGEHHRLPQAGGRGPRIAEVTEWKRVGVRDYIGGCLCIVAGSGFTPLIYMLLFEGLLLFVCDAVGSLTVWANKIILKESMTNEELFQDLKQFITAAVSQQTADLGQRIDSIEANVVTIQVDVKHLGQRINTLDEKLDLVQDAIAESMTHAETMTRATLGDHEQRLRRLERHSA
jgi:hypothetical protein